MSLSGKSKNTGEPADAGVEFSIEPPHVDADFAQRVDEWVAARGLGWEAIADQGVDDSKTFGDRCGEAHLYCAWRSLAEEPENGLRMLELGHVYADVLEDLDMAERVYEEVDRLGSPGLYPGIVEEDPFFFLAWLYFLRGRDEESIEAYRQCLTRLDDRHPEVREDPLGRALVCYHLAAVLHIGDENDKALREYAAAIDLLSSDEFDTERAVVEEQQRCAENGKPFSGEIGPEIVPEV